MTYRQDVIDSLQFVKVILDKAHMTGPNRAAGYLTDVSCHMLLAELERDGLKVIRVRATVRSPFVFDDSDGEQSRDTDGDGLR